MIYGETTTERLHRTEARDKARAQWRRIFAFLPRTITSGPSRGRRVWFEDVLERRVRNLQYENVNIGWPHRLYRVEVALPGEANDEWPNVIKPGGLGTKGLA